MPAPFFSVDKQFSERLTDCFFSAGDRDIFHMRVFNLLLTERDKAENALLAAVVLECLSCKPVLIASVADWTRLCSESLAQEQGGQKNNRVGREAHTSSLPLRWLTRPKCDLA